MADPPSTLLVLPNGWVKVAAALPHVCADLRQDRLEDAWNAYRAAWRGDTVPAAPRRAAKSPGDGCTSHMVIAGADHYMANRQKELVAAIVPFLQRVFAGRC